MTCFHGQTEQVYQHSSGFTRFKLHNDLPPCYLSIELTINKQKIITHIFLFITTILKSQFMHFEASSFNTDLHHLSEI